MKPIQNDSPLHNLLLKGAAAQPEEAFFGLFFDVAQHMISLEELCCRSKEGTPVYESELLINEVVEQALQAKATLVTVMHYSPSVEVCPMPIDSALKQGLLAALDATSVTLLDYLLIGKGGSSISLIEK